MIKVIKFRLSEVGVVVVRILRGCLWWLDLGLVVFKLDWLRIKVGHCFELGLFFSDVWPLFFLRAGSVATKVSYLW